MRQRIEFPSRCAKIRYESKEVEDPTLEATVVNESVDLWTEETLDHSAVSSSFSPAPEPQPTFAENPQPTMSLNGAQPVWIPQVEQYDHQSSRVRRLLTARSLVNMLAVISLIALIVVGIIELQHFSQLRTALAVNAVIYEQIDVVKARNEELESLNEEVSLQNLILQANRAEYAHANLELADELARKHEELAVSRERIDRLVRAERAEILSGTEGTSELQGIFYLNDAQGTLIVRGLQPLSTDQTYQFWLSLPDGNQIPASLVSVQSAQEPSWTEITLPASVPQFAGVGITIEPAGGSQQPTANSQQDQCCSQAKLANFTPVAPSSDQKPF